MKNYQHPLKIALLLSCIYIAPLEASCVSEDINGRWNVYFNNEDGWTLCRLNISKNLIFNASCDHSNGNKYFMNDISFINLNSNCVGGGIINLLDFDSPDLKKLRLSHLTFNRDKSSFTGVGSGTLGGKFTYTGVKL